MWQKLKNVGLALVNVFRNYPAYSAALLNTAVVLAAHFGWHVTADQLVAYVAVLNVLFGAIVHANVTPVAKLPSDK